MKTIRTQHYDINLGSDPAFWDQVKDHTRTRRKVIVVDDNTAQYCLPFFLEKSDAGDCPVIKIPAGEAQKNLETCHSIWDQMMGLQLKRRHSLVFILGGGVAGDMAGFCAATFKRGIHFVQVPTSLLAMVDASVGGKLGVNFRSVKNAVGVFKNPAKVFICPSFLSSLPPRELRSGFAELVKHALIGDVLLWKDLQKLDIHSPEMNWEDLIYQSLLIKNKIVEEDPFEEGLRKILNFGHTVGHALESYWMDATDPLLHGEAIAAGMICESWLSVTKGLISEAVFEPIAAFLFRQFPHRSIPEAAFGHLVDLMRQDKKNDHANRFSLLSYIGKGIYNQEVPDEQIRESLKHYNHLLSKI